jgi:hypothetical protein
MLISIFIINCEFLISASQERKPFQTLENSILFMKVD